MIHQSLLASHQASRFRVQTTERTFINLISISYIDIGVDFLLLEHQYLVQHCKLEFVMFISDQRHWNSPIFFFAAVLLRQNQQSNTVRILRREEPSPGLKFQ